MAVDVLPNPGEPHILNIRVDVSALMDFHTAAHSSIRPTKSGISDGTHESGIVSGFANKKKPECVRSLQTLKSYV